MILRPIRNATLIGAAMIALVLSPVSASAQVIVYDPSNYVQNVLQAARALQQINNQVTSLQNQTQKANCPLSRSAPEQVPSKNVVPTFRPRH